MITIGQKIKTVFSGETFIIKSKLGEGGQGIAYLVEDKNSKHFVLKWYNPEFATPEQKIGIEDLIKKGKPSEKGGERFIWPLDIYIDKGSNRFGYIMNLIDKKLFAELGEVMGHYKPEPNFQTLCKISYEIANSYYSLHLKGYCYRDINRGNIMFDPIQGDVLICDNDNIGIDGASTSQISGTWEFMAPELVLGKQLPSTKTDLHSLAVLLFQIWTWHHPFHGNHYESIRCMDIPAKRKLYGLEPVFVFNPNDRTNSLPNTPEYNTVRKRWSILPQPLKNFFIKEFTIGLTNPDARITEGEWQKLFSHIKENIVSCGSDNAENFWYEGLTDFKCWYCSKDIVIPPKLKVTNSNGIKVYLLKRDFILKAVHLDGFSKTPDEKAGELVQNPNDPKVWGIRNLTSSNWTATFPAGNVQPVPPQKSAPVSANIKIDFGTKAIGEIIP
jgi:serine/threonine protein kinase